MESEQQSKDQWGEVRAIHKQWRGFYELLRGSTVVIILLVLGAVLFVQQILNDYTTNVFTEAVGVIGTALILDVIYRRRAELERKEELILQMGSPDNAFAVEAVRILRHKGWLEDGSLKRVNLRGANLRGADLERADLQGADLAEANLENSQLSRANLQDANLYKADLKNSQLLEANLQNAKLYEADLEEANLGDFLLLFETYLDAYTEGYLHEDMKQNLKDADLASANLRRAGLANANLRGAKLYGVNMERSILYGADLYGASLVRASLKGAWLAEADLSEVEFKDTTLPDGTEWTPNIHMKRFTDQNHPDYWEPSEGE